MSDPIVPVFGETAQGPFHFLEKLPRYSDGTNAVMRMNRRYEAIVAPFKADLEGATVIDLASHDGRWPYALAHAGAREVLGIEGRQSLIDEFEAYPAGPEKDRVTLIQGDIFEQLERLAWLCCTNGLKGGLPLSPDGLILRVR